VGTQVVDIDEMCHCYRELLCTVQCLTIDLLELQSESEWVRWELMKAGLVIREFQDLETHLNRIRDFTGSLCGISNTTSSGIWSEIPFYASFSFSYAAPSPNFNIDCPSKISDGEVFRINYGVWFVSILYLF
jgi:hypothetical protein